MAEWRYYAHRWSDGQPVGELPLSDVSIEDVLSGTSTLTASMSLFDPMAAREFCAPWLREITAVRDGVIAFHGPVVGRIGSSDGKSVQISAASPHKYLYKRVTETADSYLGDVFAIVRLLVAGGLAKDHGDLYRLEVDSALAGVDEALNVGGDDRRRISELIEDLAGDDVTGFDFRWDYSWYDAAQHLVTRTLNLGHPTIGRDLTADRVVEAAIDLVDVTDNEDGMSAANRVHGLGGTSGSARLRAVAADVTSDYYLNYPLLEDVIDLSDVNKLSRVQGLSVRALRTRQPGLRAMTSTHQIGPHFRYGDVDLGDSVVIRLNVGVESMGTYQRVVGIKTEPATDRQTFSYFPVTAPVEL